jgi:hydroxyethylthiazole kinase
LNLLWVIPAKGNVSKPTFRHGKSFPSLGSGFFYFVMDPVSKQLADRAAINLQAVRQQQPLVHTITNPVVMDFTANALLALGARPIMAYAAEEVEEVAATARALVLNLGTPSPKRLEAMHLAGKAAARNRIPIVFDPVGVGLTALRRSAARQMVGQLPISVIRGNASEILGLAEAGPGPAGVAAVHTIEDVIPTARQLIGKTAEIVAVSGPRDWIGGQQKAVRVANGHALMSRVTGTGCVLSALIGAFLSVDQDSFVAVVSAMALWGVCGEMAAGHTQGPGQYRTALIDALDAITPQTLVRSCRFSKD